ncbi:MAG: hypothetical protein B7X07_01910 [Actinobacteria bacterium 21-64-8]|nr:MAG: hypothetical protein B7X07_01910 [Actinobacteria bacterium 21-64-8]
MKREQRGVCVRDLNRDHGVVALRGEGRPREGIVERGARHHHVLIELIGAGTCVGRPDRANENRCAAHGGRRGGDDNTGVLGAHRVAVETDVKATGELGIGRRGGSERELVNLEVAANGGSGERVRTRDATRTYGKPHEAQEQVEREGASTLLRRYE